MQDITLPEVAALQQRARFFKDGEIAKVEIVAVGSKDTIIKRVGPEEMAKFKTEWDAFCDGIPLTRRPGTQLTDVPGVNQDKAENYIARNVHTAEELAVLTDSQCQALGHGTLTDRKAAQAMITQRRLAQDAERRDRVGSAAKELGSERPGQASGVEELGKRIDTLAESVTALVGLLSQQAKKPGRKKEKPDAAG